MVTALHKRCGKEGSFMCVLHRAQLRIYCICYIAGVMPSRANNPKRLKGSNR